MYALLRAPVLLGIGLLQRAPVVPRDFARTIESSVSTQPVLFIIGVPQCTWKSVLPHPRMRRVSPVKQALLSSSTNVMQPAVCPGVARASTYLPYSHTAGDAFNLTVLHANTVL